MDSPRSAFPPAQGPFTGAGVGTPTGMPFAGPAGQGGGPGAGGPGNGAGTAGPAIPAPFALRLGGLIRERSRATIAILAVSQRARTFTGFGFMIGGLLATVASLTMDGGAADLTGRFGILSTHVLFGLFGKAAYLFGPALIWSGFRGLARDDWNAYLSGVLGNLSVVWAVSVFFHLSGGTPAGIAGEYFAALLEFFTGRTGAYLINGLLMFTGVLLLLQIPFEDVKKRIVDFLEGKPPVGDHPEGQSPGGAFVHSPLGQFASRLIPLIPLFLAGWALYRRWRGSPESKAPVPPGTSGGEARSQPVSTGDQKASEFPSTSDPSGAILPISRTGGNPVYDKKVFQNSTTPPWIERVELNDDPVHRTVDAAIKQSSERMKTDSPEDLTRKQTVPIPHDTGSGRSIWRPGIGFVEAEGTSVEYRAGSVDPSDDPGDDLPPPGLIIEAEDFPFLSSGTGSGPDFRNGLSKERHNPAIIYDPARNRYLFRRTENPAPRRPSTTATVEYLDSLDLHLPEGRWTPSGFAAERSADPARAEGHSIRYPDADFSVQVHPEKKSDEISSDMDGLQDDFSEADLPSRPEAFLDMESAEADEVEDACEAEELEDESTVGKAPLIQSEARRSTPAMLFPVVLSEGRYSRYRLSRRMARQSQRIESEDPEAEINENREKLEKVMADFGVQASVVGAVRGPMITLYEVRPEAGVRVNRFLGIQDEIRMNLAALSVRVVAPIPGKSTIGVELPNRLRQFVSMGDLVNGDPEFSSGKRELSIALGKDIQGVNRYVDLARLPHILIAGATGSGKSVFMNSVIASLLFNHSPDEVRFLMIDPKMVELKLYEGIPHLLHPVITDVRLADRALNWAVQEMESRYQLLSNVKCRDIRSYNERIRSGGIEGPSMPYIVLLIDELSDLMMVSAKEVEDSIIRLTQKARAVGIHVIMATQRPSVDVITSLIKANCPARISFQVAQKIDSRIILDMNGAESLLGKGDMLYKSPAAAEVVRLQSPMISEEEIEEIVRDACRYGTPRYIDLPGREEESGGVEDAGDVDQALVDAAWEIIEESGKTSTSYVQRRLRIGYNRAATIIERLEQLGYLGPAIGNRPREVLKRH